MEFHFRGTYQFSPVFPLQHSVNSDVNVPVGPPHRSRSAAVLRCGDEVDGVFSSESPPGGRHQPVESLMTGLPQTPSEGESSMDLV
jgi:hypothetical protein